MRAYRAALRAYPAAYRAERGEEILGTLAEARPDARPSPGEVASLLVAGLRERERADSRVPGAWWRGGLAALALPLACVNAAVALTGLGIAVERGTGRWWPAFALVACALAVAAAARVRVALPVLALANLAFVLGDAALMAGSGGTVPHVRLLERAPAGDVLPATVPSNPTELVPLAVVLALAAGCVRPAGGGRLLRATFALAAAGALAGLALALPDHRFAWLLPLASAAALGALVLGALYRRALVAGAAVVVAIAPSVFWYLTRGFPFEHAEYYGLATGPLQRDVVPGLLGVGALVLAALLAAAAGAVVARRSAAP